MSQSEDQPSSEEAPIFLHTSSRSYQVKGESFTPPKSSKTHTLPLGWLEETLQSEPTAKLKSSKTRPFPFPEDQQHEQTALPGRETPPFPPPAQQQGQTPIPPPLPKTPSTPVNAGAGEVPPWLVSVVASLEEEQEEPPEGHKAWKKRTLLIVLGSVVLVVVAAVVVFLLSSHIL